MLEAELLVASSAPLWGAFNTEATQQGQETDDNYIKCMHSLSIHVFPKNALMIQRQWFHRYLHKKIEDTMCEFVT
jgi:hypothetical protein